MAPRLGFEPRYPAPEAGVLPLDDLGMGLNCGPIVSDEASPVKADLRLYLGLWFAGRGFEVVRKFPQAVFGAALFHDVKGALVVRKIDFLTGLPTLFPDKRG